MPNGTYGGVRGRETKVGRKLSFPSYSIICLFFAVFRPFPYPQLPKSKDFMEMYLFL